MSATPEFSIHDVDKTFDSGALPVTASSTWQLLGRLTLNGKIADIKFKAAVNTIGNIKIAKGVIASDPDPIDIAASDASPSGFSVVAMANIAAIFPTPSFPLAAGSGGVFQVTYRGIAQELYFYANTAGGAGTTLQINGTVYERKG